MRRKLISSLLLFVLVFQAVVAFGASNAVHAEDTTVYVTIANAGTLEVTYAPVTVTDIDGDGALTVSDALTIAHTDYYPAGAEGFLAVNGAYGLSVSRLWGVDTTAVGYYVNNVSAWSLADTVQNGDSIVAWVYKDTAGWSDKYCYFDLNTVSVKSQDTVTLTLSSYSYDASWNLVSSPLSDATVTIDGVATDVKTDAAGKATITLNNAGTAVISAVSDTIIVPPVCLATVSSVPSTGVGSSMLIAAAVLCLISLLLFSAAYAKKAKRA